MSRVDVANAVLRIAALEAGMGLIHLLPDDLVRPHLTLELQRAQVLYNLCVHVSARACVCVRRACVFLGIVAV
jgi:hypothetical protein